MKKKQVEKFVSEHLLPSLPNFCVRGNLLYEVPVGSILRAFLFESSGFSATTFYPQVFVQLLYIPSEHLTLSPGKRFPGSWNFEPGAEIQLARRILSHIHEIGLPFLRLHRTPEDFIREIKANPAVNVNPNVSQQLAYSLLLLGRNDEGLDELDKTLNMIDRHTDSPPWERVLFAEVGMLKEKLMRDPNEVIQALHGWTEETRMKLHLPT